MKPRSPRIYSERSQVLDSAGAAAIPAPTTSTPPPPPPPPHGVRRPLTEHDLRAVVREAIGAEWYRRIAERVEDSTSGHIDALTDAVVARLSGSVRS